MNIDESLTKQMESARQRLHDLYKQYGGLGYDRGTCKKGS